MAAETKYFDTSTSVATETFYQMSYNEICKELLELHSKVLNMQNDLERITQSLQMLSPLNDFFVKNKVAGVQK